MSAAIAAGRTARHQTVGCVQTVIGWHTFIHDIVPSGSSSSCPHVPRVIFPTSRCSHAHPIHADHKAHHRIRVVSMSICCNDQQQEATDKHAKLTAARIAWIGLRESCDESGHG